MSKKEKRQREVNPNTQIENANKESCGLLMCSILAFEGTIIQEIVYDNEQKSGNTLKNFPLCVSIIGTRSCVLHTKLKEGSLIVLLYQRDTERQTYRNGTLWDQCYTKTELCDVEREHCDTEREPCDAEKGTSDAEIETCNTKQEPYDTEMERDSRKKKPWRYRRRQKKNYAVENGNLVIQKGNFAVQKQNLAIQNDAWEKRKGILQNQKGSIYWDTPKGITLQ